MSPMNFQTLNAHIAEENIATKPLPRPADKIHSVLYPRKHYQLTPGNLRIVNYTIKGPYYYKVLETFKRGKLCGFAH